MTSLRNEPQTRQSPGENTVFLEEDAWQARAARHRERIRPWTQGLRQRRTERRTHPVHDFLFEYYSYRPSRLEFWHPPLGTTLRYARPGAEAPYRRRRRYRVTDDTIALDPSHFTGRNRDSAEWILALLRAIDARPPHFGCAGLHEWAMVYELPPEEIRHERFPLRLAPAAIAAVVRDHGVSCTHYDAFRHFSAPARPLNKVRPTREGMLAFEQGGCLHTNMDLYKWSYKLAPWIGSELIAETFFLARDARELDMRASPYDLREIGFEPIPIESARGRRAYESAQRALSARAAPLRRELMAACEDVLARVRK